MAYTRYLGPYACAAEVRKRGFDTVVFDFFTRAECDFFKIFQKLVTPDTKFLCISNTFLYSDEMLEIKNTYSDCFVSAKNQRVGYTIEDYLTATMNLCWDSSEKIVSFFEKIKLICPDIKIISGGARTNDIYTFSRGIDTKDFMLKDYVDRWILGWGDKAVADVIENWDTIEYEDINGYKFINVGKHPEWPKYDIPISPFQSKDVVASHEMLSLEISRGCAFNCKFCHYDKGFSHKLNQDDIRSQLMHYHEEFGVYKFNLTTDCFNDNYEHVKDFHEVVKSLPFKPIFASYARADLCHKYPDIIDMMADSGFKVLQVGVESLTYKVAKASGRGLATEKVIDILSKFRDKGMYIVGNFIIGLPGETLESQRKQFEWASEQNILNARFRSLNVYPHIDDIAKVSSYPAYSLDPKRYGFTEFRFDPDMYWKHEGMDLNEARQLHKEWRTKWRKKSRKWHTRRMRLGGHPGAQSFRNEISLGGKDQSEFLKDYYTRLVS
jgi:radical SAM superfamily enzyme YgiQ (UPF0313 family)